MGMFDSYTPPEDRINTDTSLWLTEAGRTTVTQYGMGGLLGIMLMKLFEKSPMTIRQIADETHKDIYDMKHAATILEKRQLIRLNSSGV